ncbi:hypothetical protein LJB99_06415, partial [Deltaproteobacteria bacterium OttesenSCG-928-K17]|nr:hypothetical protein [Deltaproteobacteria bacterium OttesenSCG-928-K17]
TAPSPLRGPTMQLECTQCQRLLNLPDDRLPIGRAFSFTCPYCKEKNSAYIEPAENPVLTETAVPDYYEQDGYAEGENQAFSSGPAVPPQPPTPLHAPASDIDDSFAPVEAPPPEAMNFENGQPEQITLQQLLAGETDDRPKALVVYDDLDIAEMLEQKLDKMGLSVTVAVNLRDAAKQLKFANFTILLLQEDYFGSNMTTNHLLRSVQGMDSQSRRGTLVVMISPTQTTLDDLTAFSLSIDAIVNTAEIANIERILISTIARANKFYAIYREVLAEHGLD